MFVGGCTLGCVDRRTLIEEVDEKRKRMILTSVTEAVLTSVSR